MPTPTVRRSAESGSRGWRYRHPLERPLVVSAASLAASACPTDELLLSAAGCLRRPATAAFEHSSCTHAAHHAPPNASVVDATTFWWLSVSHVPPGGFSRTATCEFHRRRHSTHRAAAGPGAPRD
eukprot:1305768-Prymnesium_polylepis.1